MDSEVKAWVRWEEVVVPSDKRRREVHYYVRDDGGVRDLAVVGREKSARHMTYAIPTKFLQSLLRMSDTDSTSTAAAAAAALPPDLKFRSRRQVVDWLSSLVSAFKRKLMEKAEDKEELLLIKSYEAFCINSLPYLKFTWRKHTMESSSHRVQPCHSFEPMVSTLVLKLIGLFEISYYTAYGLSPMLDRYSEDDDATPDKMTISKVLSSGNKVHLTEKFSWLGSAWDCRKRRRHYQSFSRNGITISVHDFIYVMAEDNKRLVAYIEDLYEDLRANKMVVVRWFHKVDEVSIALPPDTDDREIFFSLCLQDFSIECIDGLAAVLSLQDFEKFEKESWQRYSSCWKPYLCRRQINNDDVKPFDITQLQGYWSQDLLRSMCPSSLKLRLKIKCRGSTLDGTKESFGPHGNCKRKPHQKSGCVDVEGRCSGIGKSKDSSVGNRLERHEQSTKTLATLKKGFVKQILPQQLHLIAPGVEIELLSQDSGIRGCWFRCMVLKRHRNKIKVQYRDVQDADGTNNLEEWVSTSRIAAKDKLGIHICGRPMVRPSPEHKGMDKCCYRVGEVVDAWWHDGWWEGIVINNDYEGKVHVYFSGEHRTSVFCPSDLRPSQDWVDSRWNLLKERPDIANMLLSDLDLEKCSDCITFQASPSDVQPEPEPSREKGGCSPPIGPAGTCRSQLAADSLLKRWDINVPDLLGNCHHEVMSWSSKRKRTHGRELFAKEFSGSKKQHIVNYKCSRQLEAKGGSSSSAFLAPKLLAVADQNCKIGGDPSFGAPLSLCSSLVLTR